MQAGGLYRALETSGLPRTRCTIPRVDGRIGLTCLTGVLSDADGRVDRIFLLTGREWRDFALVLSTGPGSLHGLTMFKVCTNKKPNGPHVRCGWTWERALISGARGQGRECRSGASAGLLHFVLDQLEEVVVLVLLLGYRLGR